MNPFRDGETVWMASILAAEPTVTECTIVVVNDRPQIAYEWNGEPRQHDLGGTPVHRRRQDAVGEWYSEESYERRALAASAAQRSTGPKWPKWTGD